MSETLCLADINAKAIDCVRRTIRRNNLEQRVDAYVSDNFEDVPATEKFDLVVANPPNYFNLNPAHPLYAKFKDDLRPNDRGWKIHEKFYGTVGPHLNPGAMLFILEIETLNTEVHIPGFDVPYDQRPEPPIEAFKRMIRSGGLTYLETVPLQTKEGFRGDIVISRK